MKEKIEQPNSGLNVDSPEYWEYVIADSVLSHSSVIADIQNAPEVLGAEVYLLIDELNNLGRAQLASELQKLVDKIDDTDIETADYLKTVIQQVSSELASFFNKNLTLAEVVALANGAIDTETVENWARLSELFTFEYDFEPNMVKIHMKPVDPGEKNILEVAAEFHEAMGVLAHRLTTLGFLDEVDTIVAKSFLIRSQPEIFKKLHFRVEDDTAVISLDELVKWYGNTETSRD